MKYMILAVCLVAFLLQGCGGTPPPPEPPKAEAPKDKTPDEYYAMLKGSFTDPGAWLALPEETVLAAIPAAVEGLKKEAGGAETENKNAAKKRLADEMVITARDLRDKEKWACVKGVCALRTQLTPDTSQTEKLLARAEQILSRPKITVQGFMDVGSQLLIILECKNLKTGETQTYRISEGEDFGDNLRLSRIIGNREAIEILDKTTKDTWEVSGPTGIPAPAPVAAPAPPPPAPEPGKKTIKPKKD